MLSHQFSLNFPQFVPNFRRSHRLAFGLSFPQSLTATKVKTFRRPGKSYLHFKKMYLCSLTHQQSHRVTLLCRVHFYTTLKYVTVILKLKFKMKQIKFKDISPKLTVSERSKRCSTTRNLGGAVSNTVIISKSEACKHLTHIVNVYMTNT